MKKQSIPIRGSPEFKKMLQNINIKKIKKDKIKKPLSERRLTLAMSRIPNIEDFLVESEINDD
jgi:hypothetical protein